MELQTTRYPFPPLECAPSKEVVALVEKLTQYFAGNYPGQNLDILLGQILTGVQFNDPKLELVARLLYILRTRMVDGVSVYLSASDLDTDGGENFPSAWIHDLRGIVRAYEESASELAICNLYGRVRDHLSELEKAQRK